MNDLFDTMKNQLCPEGVWRLSDRMQSLLEDQISKCPYEDVSEEQTRYPTTISGMRSFLDKFFARHYFQVQDSLLGYMTSDAFLHILSRGDLRVLEIGAGPAVTSLAVIDIIVSILDSLKNEGFKFNSNNLKVSCILNDTSEICLSTGQELIKRYFSQEIKNGIILNRIVTLKKDFPANTPQLWQLCQHLGGYQIISLSYILNPLYEQLGFAGIIEGLGKIEKICTFDSALLILQDKFSELLIRKVSNAVNKTCKEAKLTQYVYDSNNSKSQQSYSFFRCFSFPKQSDYNSYSKISM